MSAAEVRKLLVFVATAAGEALAYGLVPEPAVPYVMCVLAVLGAYGVWRVPNADGPGAPSPAPGPRATRDEGGHVTIYPNARRRRDG